LEKFLLRKRKGGENEKVLNREKKLEKRRKNKRRGVMGFFSQREVSRRGGEKGLEATEKEE